MNLHIPMYPVAETPPSAGLNGAFVAADATAEQVPADDHYAESLHVEGIGPGNEVTHRRSVAAGFAVDEIGIRARGRVAARPESGLMIVTVLDGTVRTNGGDEIRRGDSVLADERRAWSAVVETGTIAVVTVDTWLLRRAADERLSASADPLRALDSQPATPELAAAWKRTVEYATAALVTGAPRALIEACGQLLAVAALSCFTAVGADSAPARYDADIPVSLRRAIAFIAARAREEIGVQEIASAVHLSPRAVQYLFRKHLDETPTEHLRRVRLQRAHLDLVAAHQSSTTVSEVARRWRFGHTGRFAVLYRQTYGVSPHMTLRS